MKFDDNISGQLQRVVDLGTLVLRPREQKKEDIQKANELIAQWEATARSVLRRVFGDGDDYYASFSREIEGNHPHAYARAHGVVLAAQADYRASGIFRVRQLVEAEIFDDFLEQAEHLLASGYFQAAAVVAGCVLEDALRKLCIKNSVALDSRPKLDKMNADLAKKAVYDKLVQKQVTLDSDLRNKAAHGEWQKFDVADVERMLTSVRGFLSKHCG